MNFKNLLEDTVYRITHQNKIYINAYVNLGAKSLTSKNWGDDINYWFLREIIKDDFRLYNESPLAFRNNDVNYLVIGSTINLLTKTNSIVWGAGCITDKSPLKYMPKKVLAVRGPLTRNYLLKNGVECPPIYGDPALLLPLHYIPPKDKKHKIGLIQHVSEKIIGIDGCHSISLSKYNTWTDIIDEICSCEVIASSSLHGLIVAEAYDIPNVWIASPKLLGGEFKFHDFFQSIGQKRNTPINLHQYNTAKKLYSWASESTAKDFNLTPLIKSCPFTIKLNND